VSATYFDQRTFADSVMSRVSGEPVPTARHALVSAAFNLNLGMALSAAWTTWHLAAKPSVAVRPRLRFTSALLLAVLLLVAAIGTSLAAAGTVAVVQRVVQQINAPAVLGPAPSERPGQTGSQAPSSHGGVPLQPNPSANSSARPAAGDEPNSPRASLDPGRGYGAPPSPEPTDPTRAAPPPRSPDPTDGGGGDPGNGNPGPAGPPTATPTNDEGGGGDGNNGGNGRGGDQGGGDQGGGDQGSQATQDPGSGDQGGDDQGGGNGDQGSGATATPGDDGNSGDNGGNNDSSGSDTGNGSDNGGGDQRGNGGN
jgi:uncharacterized membrane protein YgcG